MEIKKKIYRDLKKEKTDLTRSHIAPYERRRSSPKKQASTLHYGLSLAESRDSIVLYYCHGFLQNAVDQAIYTNIFVKPNNKYALFVASTYNESGYYVSCIVFFHGPKG